jgi:hypothetical protein
MWEKANRSKGEMMNNVISDKAYRQALLSGPHARQFWQNEEKWKEVLAYIDNLEKALGGIQWYGSGDDCKYCKVKDHIVRTSLGKSPYKKCENCGRQFVPEPTQYWHDYCLDPECIEAADRLGDWMDQQGDNYGG